MLSAKLSLELEAVETRSWAFHGSLKVQQGSVEGFAREKVLRATNV